MQSETGFGIDVVIPIYRPDDNLALLLSRLLEQTTAPAHIYLLQTIDREGEALYPSQDQRISVHPVKKEDFDHGATRHYGMTLAKQEYVLMMTQDAIPADRRLLEKLAQALDREETAIAYGRQLARPEDGILEKLARQHNYPDQDRIQALGDLERLGIKTYFCSDVCAMYKRKIYFEQGGFVHPAIFNEDMIMASRVIQAGYQVAYCAQARVIHSHSYTCRQQFSRNFDLGVSQRQYREVFEGISSEKEGAGFAASSLKYLIRRGHFWKGFYFAVQCAFKLAGYQLGKRYDRLPRRVVLACTMNKSYWR